ncbi:AraC family transcriptional regulator [Aliiglaciecola sp. 3_MG-2023]|uniref:helix-turn-helix domain-containing protein n=1 Tax=Aliiglaciecola sp. 3_MG-2023 TaxID=3062644 RepID=UPI0026E357C1|nr:AraC family transcriptional regulator [Aliiglaciecola sp. 3_MG-2023]MDO6695280.1 AraC family transcriptional regulator [Aliiglaciecola sp. 3_MG-2023]
MEITLSGVQIIDIFFRFAAVGQLALLIIFLVSKHSVQPLAQVGLITCLIAYVLLTAPIENHHYGSLRNILLLITDLTPFAALWFTLTKLHKHFKLAQQAKWILALLTFWLLILAYVFLVLGGRSPLHDLNHIIGIGLLMWVIYLCLAEYLDDLDNRRRNARLLIVAFCCFYMLGLVSFEFIYQNLRDTWQFSLANAFVIFGLVAIISAKITTPKDQLPSATSNQVDTFEATISAQNKAKPIDFPQLTALNKLMNDGVFLQQELTIGKLAHLLDLPPHQLRQLINQQLGFSNFSHYLNSYRIPWVCEQFQNTSKKKIPILTIALEAGYGSIAPFNRAFKATIGQTPTQYRTQF